MKRHRVAVALTGEDEEAAVAAQHLLRNRWMRQCSTVSVDWTSPRWRGGLTCGRKGEKRGRRGKRDNGGAGWPLCRGGEAKGKELGPQLDAHPSGGEERSDGGGGSGVKVGSPTKTQERRSRAAGGTGAPHRCVPMDRGGSQVGLRHSPGARGSNRFEPDSNFKQIQIILKPSKV
jgi:hypothetical protein